MSVTLTAADLDSRCAPLIQAVRSANAVPASEIDALIPADHTDASAWLVLYGQLRAWIASATPQRDDQAQADALVTAALREVAIPVAGLDGVSVYPKSLEGMLQLKVLDAQLDRLTARLIAMIGDDASLIEVDAGVQVATAVAYVTQLLAWAWTSEGYGLPFKPTDAEPVVPPHIQQLGPDDLLRITHAAHQFSASLAACQALVDPVPARDGGKRPSWAAFFEAVGAQTHIDPRELAVCHSLAKVLSMAYLANDRQRPTPDGESA